MNTTNKSNNPNTTVLQENQSAQTSENIQSNTEQKVQGSVQNQIESLDSKTDSKAALQEQVDKTISQDTEQAFKQEGTGNNRTDIVSNGLLNQLKNEPLQTTRNLPPFSSAVCPTIAPCATFVILFPDKF